jgi:hypothetical protein
VIIRINEAKGSPKRQNKLKEQINGKFNNISSADKNKKISLQQFLPLSEAEVQGLLHPT